MQNELKNLFEIVRNAIEFNNIYTTIKMASKFKISQQKVFEIVLIIENNLNLEQLTKLLEYSRKIERILYDLNENKKR